MRCVHLMRRFTAPQTGILRRMSEARTMDNSDGRSSYD